MLLFRDRLRKELQVARQSTVGVLFEGAFSAGARRHDIASSITIFIRMCIAAAVRTVLSHATTWASTSLRMYMHIQLHTPARVSYVNATCTRMRCLTVELIVKAGCLHLRIRCIRDKTTTTASTCVHVRRVALWLHEVRVCVRGGCEKYV